jgi:hypothetical protein
MSVRPTADLIQTYAKRLRLRRNLLRLGHEVTIGPIKLAVSQAGRDSSLSTLARYPAQPPEEAATRPAATFQSANACNGVAIEGAVGRAKEHQARWESLLVRSHSQTNGDVTGDAVTE